MRPLLRYLIFGLTLPCLAATSIAGERISVLQIAGLPVSWSRESEADSRDLVLSFAVLTGSATISGGVNCGHIGAMGDLQGKSGIDQYAMDEAVAVALGRWHDVARLSFRRTDDPARADIVIGAQRRPHGIAFVDLETAPGAEGRTRAIAKAFVCLNPEQKWKIGFDGNLKTYDLVHVLTHEFGHTLGLDHPSARGHLMSFKYTETQHGLSLLDRTAVQSIYGARIPRPETANGMVEMRRISTSR